MSDVECHLAPVPSPSRVWCRHLDMKVLALGRVSNALQVPVIAFEVGWGSLYLTVLTG